MAALAERRTRQTERHHRGKSGVQVIMWFRNFLQNNFWLKLFSLFLALLIWFSVRFYTIYDVQTARNTFKLSARLDFLQVPIKVLKSTANTQSCKIEPTLVDVTVAGEKSLLQNLSARDIAPFVSLVGEQAVGVFSNQVQVYTPP